MVVRLMFLFSCRSLALFVLASCTTAQKNLELNPQGVSPFERKVFSGALYLEALHQKSNREDNSSLLRASYDFFPDAVVASSLAERVMEQTIQKPMQKDVPKDFQKGSYQEAQSILEKALLRYPSSADLLKVKGRLQHRLGDFAGAKRSFLNSLKNDPTMVDLYAELYLLHVSQNDIAGANIYAAEWYRRSPSSYVAAITNAKISFHAGDFRAALDASKKAQNLDSRRTDAFILAGFSASRLGMQKKAEGYFREAYILDPLNEDVFAFLKASYVQKQKAHQFIGLIDSVIARISKKSPILISLYLQKAFFYWSVAKPSLANQALVSALSGMDSGVDKALLLSYGYQKDRNFSMAQDVLAKASPNESERDMVLVRQANISLQQSNSKQALKFLEKVSSANKGLRFALVKSAALEGLGHLKQAMDLLGATVKSFPQSAEALYSLGYMYGENNRIAQAVRVMEGIIQKHPEFADAYNYLGLLNARGASPDHIKAALGLIAIARTLKPSDPFFMDSHGWLLFRSGNRAKGAELIRKAQGLGPNVAEIGRHYFIVLYTQGKLAEAKRLFDGMVKKGVASSSDYNHWKKAAGSYNVKNS